MTAAGGEGGPESSCAVSTLYERRGIESVGERGHGDEGESEQGPDRDEADSQGLDPHTRRQPRPEALHHGEHADLVCVVLCRREDRWNP